MGNGYIDIHTMQVTMISRFTCAIPMIINFICPKRSNRMSKLEDFEEQAYPENVSFDGEFYDDTSMKTESSSYIIDIPESVSFVKEMDADIEGLIRQLSDCLRSAYRKGYKNALDNMKDLTERMNKKLG